MPKSLVPYLSSDGPSSMKLPIASARGTSRSSRVFKTRLTGTVFALATIFSLAHSFAQTPPLTHHAREQARSAPLIRRLPEGQIMNLDFVLALSDPSSLDNLLAELTDPTSPNFRKYLSVQEFTKRYGPSPDDYDKVVQFAKEKGFEVTGGSLDGMDVQVRGSVSAVENALHVTMNEYKHPKENRTFYAADRHPTCRLPFGI